MNGIICVYKEKGFTSFDVVAILKRICGTRKVGHGGTLDPMAEGVLPVFVGNATKAVDYCPDNTKEYVAGFKFGVTTDTQDITGKIIKEVPADISKNLLLRTLTKFTGDILQVPPMYSAVQINGRRLYDLARAGETVEREPRPVNISKIRLERLDGNEGIIRVGCSKGTYIRTLINDIGDSYGCGAVMTSLVRTRSGVFTLNDCHRISELEEIGKQGFDEVEKLLMPIDKLFKDLPRANLDKIQTSMYKNGVVLDADRIKFDRIYPGDYAIYSCDNRLLGLGKINVAHELFVIQRFKTDILSGKRDISELSEVKFGD